MSINLAIRDAATNCERDGAMCRLTLRSGRVITGKIKTPPSAAPITVQMEFEDGGWATVQVDEIAAVEAHPR